MKVKLLFIILIVFSLTSCKHKEKYEFIQRYLENPEKLEEILLSSEFDTEKFRNFFLKTEIDKNEFIEWADRFIIIDENKKKSIYFETKGCHEGGQLFDKTNKIENPLFTIWIDNKTKDFSLVFEWFKKENGQWYLSYIKKNKKRDFADEDPNVYD